MSTNDPLSFWRRFEGITLLLVASACLAFQLWLPSTHIQDADYQAVAKVLEQEKQPGDAVLLVPWWTERARIFVPAGLTVVGYQGSDGDNLERHRRIWVLSEPQLPRAAIADFEKVFLPQRTQLNAPRTFGNLQLQLFANGRHRALQFDAVDALPGARVFLETAGARQPCAWTGVEHRCPNGRSVRAEWHEVHFAPYRCLKMEAPGGNTALTLEWDVPPAEQLALSAGFIWEYGAHRGDNISPAVLSVAVDDGRQPHKLELPVGVETMQKGVFQGLRESTTVRLSLQATSPTSRVTCALLEGTTKAAP